MAEWASCFYDPRVNGFDRRYKKTKTLDYVTGFISCLLILLPAAPTFIRDADNANAFSKLSRYEAGVAWGLYNALRELQRLQATRGAGGNVSPPVAVDVDVSGVAK